MEEQQLYGWSEYADEFAYEIDVSAAIQDPFTSQGDHDGEESDDDTDDKKVATDDDTDDDDGLDVGLEQDERWNAVI